MTINGIDWIRVAAPYIAESWIANLWQGILLALGAWACLKMLPRISASTRFAVWFITFAAIALLPLLRVLPFPLPAGRALAAQAAIAPPSHSLIQLAPTWALGIAGLWFAAILMQALRLSGDLRTLQRIRRMSTAIAAEKLSSELLALLNSTGRRVQLRLSETTDTPSAIGFFRPAVILPSWLWEEFSTEQLKQVLVHELAHLRRYDDWTNLLQKFVRMLLPVNPALYWAEKRLCFEREMACDDAVLSASVAPREYATCLTTLAGKKLAQRSAVLAPGAVEKQSDLSRRVHSLLSRTRNSSLLVARGVAAGFLLATFSGAVAFTQCPQWISFASPAAMPMPVMNAAGHDRIPAVKMQLASLRTAAPLPIAKGYSAKLRPAVLPHNTALQRRKPVSVAAVQLPQKADAMPVTEKNSQVWIVLSVWQTMSEVQIRQTALIFTESSSDSSKPVAQMRQGWFILQI